MLLHFLYLYITIDNLQRGVTKMAAAKTVEAKDLEKIASKLNDIEKRLRVLEAIANDEDKEINKRIESISERVDDLIKSIRMG